MYHIRTYNYKFYEDFFSIYLYSSFYYFCFFSRIDVILVRKAHLFWHLRCVKISKGKNFKICTAGTAQDCRSLSERKSRKRITFCINYKYTKCSNSHIHTYTIYETRKFCVPVISSRRRLFKCQALASN